VGTEEVNRTHNQKTASSETTKFAKENDQHQIINKETLKNLRGIGVN